MLIKFISISLFLWAFGLEAQSSLYDLPSASLIDSEVVDRAQDITRNDHTDEERVRSIYQWIWRNIRYRQLDELDRRGSSTALKTLEVKQGVCLDFAHLFRDMCIAVGIDAFIVNGYALQEGERGLPQEPNHAWNSAFIHGRWYLFDVTWASGGASEIYFKKIRLPNHVPAFYGWELINCSSRAPVICGLADSLKLFVESLPMDRAIMEARSDVIINPGPSSERYYGGTLIDKGIQLKERGDDLDGARARKLYHDALLYFELGNEYCDAQADWQQEAYAMTILNLQRIRFNGLIGDSYNVDNLKDIVSNMSRAVEILESLTNSLTANIAVIRTQEDIAFIRKEIAAIKR